MPEDQNNWTLLVYKIPPYPTRLRLQIWRRLQRMGALYLQDAVCLVPSRPDLVENMQYIAQEIAEMGGTYHLFCASTILPEDAERIAEGFRLLANARYEEIVGRVGKVEILLPDADTAGDLEQVEEEIKRERVAYLKAQRISYFGALNEGAVQSCLDELRIALDTICRCK